jgi:competence protein ComEC
MKRPWGILAAGFVLGEVLALKISFFSIPAAALLLAACFFVWKMPQIRGGQNPVLLKCCRRIFLPARSAADKRRMAARFLLLSALLAGAVRLCAASLPSDMEEELDRIMKENPYGTELTVKADGAEYGGSNLVIRSGCLLIYIPTADSETGFAKKAVGFSAEDPPKIGNTVRVTGKLSRMEHASNPGQFDFAEYYRAKGITHRLSAKTVEIMDRHTEVPAQKIADLKKDLKETLLRVCEKEDAGFLCAALLGDRSELSEDMYDRYRKNGIAHLLAISGLHIAIIGMSLYKLLRKAGLSAGLSGVAAGTFLTFYGIFTGSGTSVNRAVIMFLLVSLALSVGRTYDLLSALFFSAVLILLFSPYELFQCGFQLSFMAVFAIGGPAAFVRRELRVKGNLQLSLLTSTSVTLFTLPVIAWWFFSFPPYGIVLNLIVIPLMGYAVWSGMAIFFLDRISFPASLSAAGVTHRVLQIYTASCNAVQMLPLHRVLTGRPRMWQIAAYYLLLGAGLFLLKRIKTDNAEKENRNDRKWEEWIRERRVRNDKKNDREAGWLKNEKKRRIAAGIFFAAAVLSVLHIPNGKTEISFLNIGQGDAVVIRDQGKCTLIDGGSSTNQKAGEYILRPFLEYHAVGRADEVFLTHADADHTNAVEYLLTQNGDIRIGTLYLNAPAERDEKYDTLRKEIEKNGCALRYIGKGDVIGALTCISPEKDLTTTETNEESLVMLFRKKKFSCLFTGDAGKESEGRILQEAEENKILRDSLSGITVLKVGHHGSRNSSGEAFLKLLDPKISILSYGKGNRYGHPNKETVVKLSALPTDILRTAVKGCITIETDGTGMRVETYRKD